MEHILFYFSNSYNRSEKPLPKIKCIKRMSFRQYIPGFYNDIKINPPFENKDIQKNWLICDKN